MWCKVPHPVPEKAVAYMLALDNILVPLCDTCINKAILSGKLEPGNFKPIPKRVKNGTGKQRL